MGRGRGGGGSGGGGNSNLNDPQTLIDASEQRTPGDAASELGLTPEQAQDFNRGADNAGKLLPGKPDAGAIDRVGQDLSDMAKRAKAQIAAYERKYGRGAARTYSSGIYWTLLRYAKAAMAATTAVTQVGGAPAHALPPG